MFRWEQQEGTSIMHAHRNQPTPNAFKNRESALTLVDELVEGLLVLGQTLVVEEFVPEAVAQ
jgi:hypothetical protein